MRVTKTSAAGFTIIELMIVVVILGIITMTVAPSVSRGQAGASPAPGTCSRCGRTRPGRS